MGFNRRNAMTTKEELKKAADLLNAHALSGERLAFVNPDEEKMLKEAGGAGIPAAGGVPSYVPPLVAGAIGGVLGGLFGGRSKSKPKAPEQPSYGESLRSSLEAQIAMAPALYKAEADPETGRPAYAELETKLLEDNLKGHRVIPKGAVKIKDSKDRYTRYVNEDPKGLKKHWEKSAIKKKYGSIEAWGKFHWKKHGKKEGRKLPPAPGKYWNPKTKKALDESKFKREGGLIKLMGSSKEMDDGRKPGFDEAGDFMGMTQLGEDLRQQAATTTRAADLKDVQRNLAAFNKIQAQVTPKTRGALDNVVTAMGDEFKRLGKGAISDPANMQEVAQRLNRGELTKMKMPKRAPLDEMGNFRRAKTIADMDLGARGRAPQLTGEARGRAAQMDLGARGRAGQLEARQRGPLERVGVADRGMGERMGGYSELQDPLGLRATMQQQAAEDLEAGRGFTPRQRREAEQAARRWWQAAGRGLDPLAAVREVEELMKLRGDEQARRRAFAGQVIGQEAALQTGELGRGMQQAGFNIKQEVARQEANLGRQLTAQEFNALQEAQRQRENVATGMGAQQFNIQQEVARQEANLGRRLTEQEFNTLQETARQEANIARRMGAGQFNIQNEIARQEANLGRRLTEQEFNILQETQRQEANVGRAMEASRFNIGMEAQRQEADIARNLAAQEFNIRQEEARRAGNIGREMQAMSQDVTQKMQQQQMNEQLRQRQLQGYLAGQGQVAGMEQAAMGDPMSAILNRPAGTAGFGMGQQMYGGAGYGLTASPGVAFNPEAGLSYMLGQQANQANLAAAEAGASAQRSAGLFGGIGRVVGGMASGGTGIFG